MIILLKRCLILLFVILFSFSVLAVTKEEFHDDLRDVLADLVDDPSSSPLNSSDLILLWDFYNSLPDTNKDIVFPEDIVSIYEKSGVVVPDTQVQQRASPNTGIAVGNSQQVLPFISQQAGNLVEGDSCSGNLCGNGLICKRIPSGNSICCERRDCASSSGCVADGDPVDVGSSRYKCVRGKLVEACASCDSGWFDTCSQSECEGLGDCNFISSFRMCVNANTSVCEKCGDGLFNLCDSYECKNLGNCRFDKSRFGSECIDIAAPPPVEEEQVQEDGEEPIQIEVGEQASPDETPEQETDSDGSYSWQVSDLSGCEWTEVPSMCGIAYDCMKTNEVTCVDQDENVVDGNYCSDDKPKKTEIVCSESQCSGAMPSTSSAPPTGSAGSSVVLPTTQSTPSPSIPSFELDSDRPNYANVVAVWNYDNLNSADFLLSNGYYSLYDVAADDWDASSLGNNWNSAYAPHNLNSITAAWRLSDGSLFMADSNGKYYLFIGGAFAQPGDLKWHENEGHLAYAPKNYASVKAAWTTGSGSNERLFVIDNTNYYVYKYSGSGYGGEWVPGGILPNLLGGNFGPTNYNDIRGAWISNDNRLHVVDSKFEYIQEGNGWQKTYLGTCPAPSPDYVKSRYLNCVECTTDSQCYSSHPYCSSNGVCIQCKSDSQCTGAKPYCNFNLNICTECRTQSPTQGSGLGCPSGAWCQPIGIGCGHKVFNAAGGTCQAAGTYRDWDFPYSWVVDQSGNLIEKKDSGYNSPALQSFKDKTIR